jgi:hypothetical protein
MQTIGVKATIIESTPREKELGIIRLQVSSRHRDLLRAFVRQRDEPTGPYLIVWEDWGKDARDQAIRFYRALIDGVVMAQNGGIRDKSQHRVLHSYFKEQFGPDAVGTPEKEMKHITQYTREELWNITTGVIRTAAEAGIELSDVVQDERYQWQSEE